MVKRRGFYLGIGEITKLIDNLDSQGIFIFPVFNKRGELVSTYFDRGQKRAGSPHYDLINLSRILLVVAYLKHYNIPLN